MFFICMRVYKCTVMSVCMCCAQDSISVTMQNANVLYVYVLYV